jgi:hypothetical protein
MVRDSFRSTAPAAPESQSFGDINRELSASFAARFPAPKERGRLPLPEDALLPGWRPPPSKEALREAAGKLKPEFIKYQRDAGSEFVPPEYMRGKLLDTWTAERAVKPYRCYEKFIGEMRGLEIQRFRRQPEPWPEPDNSLCEPRHRTWLEQHAKTREKHLHPVYYAALKKEQQEEENRRKEQELAKQKALTRDAKTAASDSAMPKMGKGLKDKLKRASLRMQVGKAIEEHAVEAKKNREAAKDPNPGRVKHLFPWSDANRNGRYLGLSHPWQEHEELLVMKTDYLSKVKKGPTPLPLIPKSKALMNRSASEADLDY